jgi:hypothetical protein
MSLNVDITGNADSAVSALKVSDDAFAKLDASVQQLIAQNAILNSSLSGVEGALTKTGAAAVGATGGVVAHTAALKETKDVEEQVAGSAGTLARGFSALGVDAGAAAARVQGLAGAIEELKAAAPAFLAISAGMIAVFGTFNLLKSGIESAEALQASMSTLESSVNTQGASWDKAGASIKKFLDVESLASGFTQGELAQALNRLVTSNISVSDSETILSVAEETAVAKHTDVLTVVDLLIDAEAGRGIGLAKLDPQIKAIIQSHGTLSQVLKVLHKDNADQLDDTSSLEQAKAREKVAWDNTSRAIGDTFLPILTQVSYSMIGAIANADTLGEDMYHVFHDIGIVIADAGKYLKDFAAGSEDLFSGNFSGAVRNFEKTIKDGTSGMRELTVTGQDVGTTLRQAFLGPDAAARGYDIVLKNIKDHLGDIGTLQKDPHLGMKGPGSGTGFVAPASSMEVQQTELQTAAQKEETSVTNALAQAKQSASVIEDALTTKIKLSTTAAEENAAALDLNKQKLADLHQQMGILTEAIGKETSLRDQDQTALERSTIAYNKAKTSLDGYQQSLQGKKALELGDKTENESMTAAVANAKSAMDDAKRAVDSLNAALGNHKQALVSTTNAYNDLSNAPAEAIAALQKKWNEFYRTTNADTDEDLQTFKLTNEQKVAYFQISIDAITDLQNGGEAKLEALYRKQTQAYEGEAKDRYQSELTFANEVGQDTAQFVDGFIGQNRSMADALKSIYGNILQSFESMLAKMVANAIMAIPWIQALFGGGVVDPATASTDVQLGAGGPGSLGSSAVSAGASSTLGAAISRAMSPSGGGGSVGSGSYAFGGGAGGGYGGGYGGGGGSMSPDFSMSGGGLGPGGGGAPSSSGGASGGGYGSSGYHFGPGGGGSPAMTGLAAVLARSGLGSILGVAGGGAMVGGLAFGGKGYSALGGALGGAGILGLEALFGGTSLAGALPALLASGPLGWGVLAGSILLGAFAGSMFGDHFNPANEPDQGSTQDAWGIANADMQGMTSANPMNASGKQYVMDSQTSAATSGKGWNLLMEQFVSKFRGSQAALPSDLQGVFPQIEQLWGGATDKQFFNPDGKDGYLDIGSGKRALWSDFWGVVQAHGQEISQLMQTFTPTDIYLSSLSGGMHSGGSSTPSPGGGGFSSPFALQAPGGGGNSNAIASGGPGRLAGSLAQRLSQSVAININVRNSSTLADTATLERGLRDAFGTALPSLLEDLNVR